jgi:chaperonin GroEL
MQKGINLIVDAVRPTLGPRPRGVAIDRMLSDKIPEILDDGGTIVRRIVQIADRDADVGAMLVRQMLWELHEDVGDGTATAAVLFQSIYNGGVRYLTAGGNAMMLRGHLESGLRVILNTLDDMAVPLEGKEELAEIAESICYDPPLAELLGEIFDIIGAYGRLEVRKGRGRGLQREYVEGMYWDEGVLSRNLLLSKDGTRTDMENTAILVSDFKVKDPRPLVPIVRWAVENEPSSLLIIAKELPKIALGLLTRVNEASDDFMAIAVKTPGVLKPSQVAALQDLAVLTGGGAFTETAGHTLNSVKPEDLGRARRSWATRSNFGIIGGRGDPRALRKHIWELREVFERVEEKGDRRELRQRIGKLMGGSATLRVGGVTEMEAEARKELAKRTGSAMRAAIRGGALPGGGVAFLGCRSSLREGLERSSGADERAAYHMLLDAVEMPIRTIVSNAGYDASEVLAQLKLAGPAFGFDVRTGEVVDVVEAGIRDVADVQKRAVESAVRTAALALTVDVLIHRKDPEKSMTP